MQQLIERLYEDHKHLSRVINCLQKEMYGFSGGPDAPDMSVILDAMDYIRNYPDAFHHPLEDRIYAQMESRISDTELLQMLQRIELQHHQLHALSTRLQNDFHAIANDQAMPVERLLNDFQAYHELIAEHMKCENRYLIPAIEQYLQPEELEAIREELDARPDPMFGGQLLAQYEGLYKYLIESEQAA
ncbi:hemerythrin domain-containing protein [Aestuariirhabdus sp. Z084]|uniref:hemerythrin domain-containing protein n=1 Tax=Aestuariirhabdus haliotis TaxID=2918751 RepID=UPI00201B3F39|nr:hemerythrin domain-containing protein [Aestuariirhabdus haliotis]MCL6414350.1 hemerythrin domain-containing protein [Aestuariirhabdus haliotis]MCL6418282.1 hemerythrin domain-containing protein [Aestuariirhabdus haliotis]